MERNIAQWRTGHHNSHEFFKTENIPSAVSSATVKDILTVCPVKYRGLDVEIDKMFFAYFNTPQ